MERDAPVEVNLLPIEGPVSNWLVEMIDEDGGVHRAEFCGKYAEADARLWARTAYPQTEAELCRAPTKMGVRPKPSLVVIHGGADVGGSHG